MSVALMPAYSQPGLLMFYQIKPQVQFHQSQCMTEIGGWG